MLSSWQECLALECDGESVLHFGYVVEGEPVEVMGGYFFNVATVVLAEDNVGDVGTFGSEDFFFDASNCSDGTTEGDFASHGDSRDDFLLGEGRNHGDKNSDAC